MRNKKIIVLFFLFIGPLLFYIFLALGTWNSTTLPTLTKNVENINGSESFENHYSIVSFLGNDLTASKTALFNLNEVIYKRFYKAIHFQMVVILPKGMEAEIAPLKKRLGTYTDASQWKFIFVSKEELVTIFNSLDTPYVLNNNYASNYTFIIDRDLSLRGRTDDEDAKDGKLYGYDMTSVAVLRNKMRKDIEVIYYHLKKKFEKDERDRNKGKIERLKER